MLNKLFSKKHQDINEDIDSSPLDNWFEENNKNTQLAVDVYQTDKKIVIKSIIAGLKPENLKISLHNDFLTIKALGQEDQNISEKDYIYQECCWNSFSRSLLLPHEVDNTNIEAALEDGILTITLYKIDTMHVQVKIKS